MGNDFGVTLMNAAANSPAAKHHRLTYPNPLADFKKEWQLWVMALPCIVLLFVFIYIPMYGIVTAFQKYNPVKGILRSEWVGFYQIARFLRSPNFSVVMRNTISISLYSLLAGFPIPVILAISLNSCPSRGFRKVVQQLTYAPYFISTVVMVGMVFLFLDPISGIVNNFIKIFNDGEGVHFMARPRLFSSIYVWSGVWQTMGWSAIIYLAVLTQVPGELYDAAMIDGCGIIQRIRHIEIPTLAPTITILLILATGGILSVGFEKIFLMQNPVNKGISEVISTFVYNVSLGAARRPNFSYAAAVGIFQSAVNLIILLSVNKAAEKINGNSFF